MIALRRGTAISHDIDAEAAHDITAEAAHAKSIPKRRLASQPDLAGFVEVQLRSLTRRYSDGRAVGQANLRAVPVGGRVRAKLGSPHPGHICTGTGLIPATSAPGLGSPLPHLRRDWAHPLPHLCTGTGLTPAHLCRDWGLTLPTSTAGTVHCTRLPHLHRRLDEPADGVGRTAMPQQCATRAHLRKTGAPTPSSCGTARREAQRACAARHRLSAHAPHGIA
jgi:hypothetical protein